MRRSELALLPKLPLLITESADEFDALLDAFEREIKPRGIIEQMYVHDISAIVWEILRLRRGKGENIKNPLRSALEKLLLGRFTEPRPFLIYPGDEERAPAPRWFTPKTAKKKGLNKTHRLL